MKPLNDMNTVEFLADAVAGMSDPNPIDWGVAVVLTPVFIICCCMIIPFYFIGKLYLYFIGKT